MKRNEKEYNRNYGDDSKKKYYSKLLLHSSRLKCAPKLIEASQIVGKCSSLQSVFSTKDEFSHFWRESQAFFSVAFLLIFTRKKEKEEKMRIVCAFGSLATCLGDRTKALARSEN